MADYSGAESIGFLLGGGAKQLREGAFDEGRLNTAKTEQALASARESQLKAKAAQTKQREAENFEQVAVENGMDPKEAALIGNLIRSEGGADFSAATTGLGNVQEQGFRSTLADVGAPAETRLRAGQAIQGKVAGDFAPIGTQGVVDLTQDDQELLRGPGTGTTAQRNYEYSQDLPPDKRSEFSPFVRADQFVPTDRPTAVHRAVGNATTPIVSADDAAANAAAVEEGKTTGRNVAAQKKDYPLVRYALDQNRLSVQSTNQIIDELLADEKLWQAVGPTQLISQIPGSQGAYIRGKLDTLGNKQMLQTLINLRSMSKTGGAVGNVSDREGDTMRGAQGAITNFNLMAGDMRKELERVRSYNDDFLGNMEVAFAATYDAQGNPILSATPRGAAPGAEEGGPTLEEIVLNSGDAQSDESGNIVRTDGWIFMRSADGSPAWVSPDGTEFEPIAE